MHKVEIARHADPPVVFVLRLVSLAWSLCNVAMWQAQDSFVILE
jgi:hypothetical protein